MRPFAYEVPSSVEEAVSLLDRFGENARPLAGGTDLVVQMRHGRRSLDRVLDIKRIPELRCMAYDGEAGLTIGAAMTCAEIGENPDVRTRYPGLLDGVSIIGGTAIQGRATIGGNLCNASPSGDAIPPLIVLRATCNIAGPDGKRSLPVEDFCIAPGQTALQKGELLVSLHLPPPAPHAGARYLRFTPRGEMDIAVAGVGAWVALNDDHSRIEAARIALGAVAPTPLLVQSADAVLVGQSPTKETLSEAAHMAQEVASPIDDVRGGTAQRRHLVGVLVKRALRGAIERAKGEEING